jgi:hypothetical protein
METFAGGPETGYVASISLRFPNNRLYVGIRNFIVGVVVKLASDEVAARKERTYLNKLNLALVQVCVPCTHRRLLAHKISVRFSNRSGRTTGQVSFQNLSILRGRTSLCARTIWSF